MRLAHTLSASAVALSLAATPVYAADQARQNTKKRIEYSLQAVPENFGWDAGDVVVEGHLLGRQWIYRLKNGVYVCYRKDADGGCKTYARIKDANPRTFDCFVTQSLSYSGGNRTNWCYDEQRVWDGNNQFKRLDVSPKGLTPIIAGTSCATDEIYGYTVGKQTYSVDGTPVSPAKGKEIKAAAATRSANACIGD